MAAVHNSGLQPAALALLLGLACSAHGSLRSHPLYSLRCSGILPRVSVALWAAAETKTLCRAVFFNGWVDCHVWLFLDDGQLTGCSLGCSQRGPFRQVCPDPVRDLTRLQRRWSDGARRTVGSRFVAT